jgi:branched-chain amino acid transport system permease protein
VLLISLTTFLLAMIGGITTVTGAFIGGMALPILGEIEANFENLDLDGLFIGAGAILISRLPNGFAGLLLALPERYRRRGDAAAGADAQPAEPPPIATPEAVPA